MTNIEISLLITSIVLAILFIIVRTIVGGHISFLLKTLASFSLVVSSIIGLCLSDGFLLLPMGFICISLLLGLIGDMSLDLKVLYDKDNIFLNLGMLSFGLGHATYFTAYSLIALDSNIDLFMPILIACGTAIILTVAIMLTSKYLKLNFGNYLWQSIGYTFILSFMTIYSLILSIKGGLNIIVFIGLLLFFLSDVILSLQYFGNKLNNKILIASNHTLYYAAQILLLSSLFIL